MTNERGTQMSRYAVVGFGNAGYQAVKAIREQDIHAWIDVYSDRSFPPANPMLTTYYARGTLKYQAMFPYGTVENIVDRCGIHFYPGKRVSHLDAEHRTLILEDGTQSGYDAILIATGASAFVPGAQGMDLQNVLTIRTVEDAVRLKSILDRGEAESVVVAGASMTGIKIAELARMKHLKCCMFDGAEYMFPLAAYRSTAERIETYLRQQGIQLAFSSFLEKIEQENGRLTAVMKNGTRYAGDVIAVCIGTRANTQIVKDTGIQINKGILADRKMRTNFDGIYAAGDCAEGYELQSKARVPIGL